MSIHDLTLISNTKCENYSTREVLLAIEQGEKKADDELIEDLAYAYDMPDGEICVTASQEKPDFESVFKRFQTSNPKKISTLRTQLPVQYCVFDIIPHKGEDVSSLPLLGRKNLLHKVVMENNYLSHVRWMEEDNAEELFNLGQG
jgi:ATP-dependent DNA ligase